MGKYKISAITVEQAYKIIDYPKLEEYKGRYIIENDNGVYIGIDNHDGNAWTEDFASESQCRGWLNGNFEKGDIHDVLTD